MATLTKAQAQIAADMLTDAQRTALKVMAGEQRSAGGLPYEDVMELYTLGFIKDATDILSGKTVTILTAMGKKVAAAERGA
jgi:hypothetical protein